MIIERTNNEIIFRLPATMNIDELQDIADFLEFKEISKKSKATQKDVDNIYAKAEDLTSDIDIDDCEFIALTDHMKGKLWSGDKRLIKGLLTK